MSDRGNPMVLGTASFSVGASVLGLILVGAVPLTAINLVLPFALGASGLGLVLTTAWCIAAGDSFGGCLCGTFAGFWLSYAVLSLGTANRWFTIPADVMPHVTGLFVLCWILPVFCWMLVSVRVPVFYTLFLAAVVIALVLLTIGFWMSAVGVERAGGWVILLVATMGWYLMSSNLDAALGGPGYWMGAPLHTVGSESQATPAAAAVGG